MAIYLIEYGTPKLLHSIDLEKKLQVQVYNFVMPELLVIY